MASLISLRVSYRLLISSPSLSIYSQSLLFRPIAKLSSQNLKPRILDPRASYRLLTSSPSLSIYSQSLLFRTMAKSSSQDLKPRILDPRVCCGWLTSSPSLSIYSQSLLFHTIAKLSSQNLKPRIQDPGFVRPRPAAFATSRWPSKARSSYASGLYLESKSEIPESLEKEMLMGNLNGAKNAFTVLSVIHLSLGGWIFYIQPFPSLYATCSILASAISVWPIIKMHRWLRRMRSAPSDMGMEEIFLEDFSVAYMVHRWTTLLALSACMLAFLSGVRRLQGSPWDWFEVQVLLGFLPACVCVYDAPVHYSGSMWPKGGLILHPRDPKLLNMIFHKFRMSTSLSAVLSGAVIVGFVAYPNGLLFLD